MNGVTAISATENLSSPKKYPSEEWNKDWIVIIPSSNSGTLYNSPLVYIGFKCFIIKYVNLSMKCRIFALSIGSVGNNGFEVVDDKSAVVSIKMCDLVSE